MRPLEKVLDRVEGVEEQANGYWALCPAHDDRNTPNLHVTEGEDGRVLLKCFAGCSQPAILDALKERGLEKRDLFAGEEVSAGSGGSVVRLNGRSKGSGRRSSGSRGGRGRLVDSYHVKDASGRLVAIHERWEGPAGKSFLWKHPNGEYSRRGEISPASLPLYGAERLYDWPEVDRGVVLVEGEKAADALLELGIRALGTVTGSSSAPGPEALEVLAGRRVILWPDDDRSGREHMRRVAEGLQGIASAVRWFEWKGPADITGPDAADHPAVQSGDRAGLRELGEQLAKAPAWEPEARPDSEDLLAAGEGPPSTNGRDSGEARGALGFNLTDLGNSERFVADHGEGVRYCYPWGKWLVWTGARWERDDSGKAHKLAKATVRGIYAEAAAESDDARRKELAKHATRSEAEAKIRAMLELAKSELPVAPDELDVSADLLNVLNGTIDLRTGELREHQREDLITKVAPVEYDPDAAAPAWEAFLERVLPGEDLRRFVQRAAGYSATANTSEQCMFINHGAGNNGKSTFQETLAAALGDYAMRAPTEMLMAKRSGGVPNDVARLKGARFVTASETEEGRRLAESLVKDLTGQDTISARFMKAEWFDFRPTHKLWLSTNHKPEIRGTDNAIWRRIRLVPWAVTVPPEERDRELPQRLREELPGVLAWVVRGCCEWRHEGLRTPDEVRRATGEYRAEMDVLASFLEDCCVVGPTAWAKFADLYAAYQRWCSESGVSPESKPRLGNRLKERGYPPDRGTGNVPIRRGIGLRDPRPSGPDGGGVTEGNWGYPGVTPENPSKSAESDEGSYPSYPSAHISGPDNISRGVSGKKSNSGNSGNSEGVQELLAKPPDWLRQQADKHLEKPSDRTLNPLCVAVAAHLYSDAGRWQEVKPAVERWLGNLGNGVASKEKLS
ncbi:MAG: phage/plasmid primase, P4 family [Actinomycetota bacterium]|nr:phage/plasmid primase, P4 family [Actinomycetota bacterium]